MAVLSFAALNHPWSAGTVIQGRSPRELLENYCRFLQEGKGGMTNKAKQEGLWGDLNGTAKLSGMWESIHIHTDKSMQCLSKER